MSERPDELEITAPYPYVVVRWMPALYGRKAVVFVDEATGGLSASTRDVMRVVCARPYIDGCLTRSAREHSFCASSRKPPSAASVCCVFAPDDAVYCRPDGKVRRSREPRSGGAQLDNVTVQGRARSRH